MYVQIYADGLSDVHALNRHIVGTAIIEFVDDLLDRRGPAPAPVSPLGQHASGHVE